MKTIAIFASGAGTNAARIIEHFRDHPTIRVGLIVCNKHGAGVLRIAERAGIEVLMLEKEVFFGGDAYVAALRERGIDFLVLAGFLWKIPAALVKAYSGKILNIHPALLPKFGGKGMYGRYVHEAVVAAGEEETGITVHFVDEFYDHGQVVFQARVAVEAVDGPEEVAGKIHRLEQEYFPGVIEDVVMGRAPRSRE
jgi:phosphoribosylglycinamide formyltransferase-1